MDIFRTLNIKSAPDHLESPHSDPYKLNMITAPHSMRHTKKIFVIGFHKTGTTSLNELFRSVGLNSVHTTTPVLSIIDKYDAYTDGSHDNFAKYYAKYPNSLFILNTRPVKKWLISKYKHAKHSGFVNKSFWPPSEEKTYGWIDNRETHYNNILRFFKDKPSQLMIVNIERRGWEKAVLKYIKKRAPATRVHLNKRSDDVLSNNKMTIISDIVTSCLETRAYTGDELLLKDIDMSQYNYTTFL